MAQALCEMRYGAEWFSNALNWQPLGDNTYECRVLLCPEPNGGYSAFAMRLPGVVSEGETIEEALGNIADAFQAAVQTYLDSSESIPWSNVELERPNNCMERWILVNV